VRWPLSAASALFGKPNNAVNGETDKQQLARGYIILFRF
jgi:hypothetical protein